MTTDQPAVETQVVDQAQIDLQHQVVIAELQKLLELLRLGRKDVDAWKDLIQLYVQALLRVESSKGGFGRLIHVYYHVENLIAQDARTRRAARKEKALEAKKK